MPPARARLSGLSPLARASARSKPEDVAKVFADADADGDGVISSEELKVYLGDYLGYGTKEISAFFEKYSSASSGGIDQDSFKSGYASLNPYLICKRSEEVLIRKPGSINAKGAQMNIEDLTDCTVLICDKSDQVFVDGCKNCRILIGPCSSSTFVRDCEGCTLWIAARQLRTRDCKKCDFHLHSHTEPVIESSQDLGFAPFCAAYPGLAKQIELIASDPKANFWSAIFDFTGKADRANWRILPLDECSELKVLLEGEGDPENPWPPLSHDLLCERVPKGEGGAGQSIANIPQTRPSMPSEVAGAKPRTVVITDGAVEPPPEPAQVAAETPADVPAPDKRPKPKLRKPKWITVDKIKPELGGVNIFAKVVKATPVAGTEDVSDVVVGDPTAVVTVRVRGDQVDVCKPGQILRIQNAKSTIVKGFIRLQVNKWAVLKPAPSDHADLEPKLSKDISATEYELSKA